ncbi:hypothetical protein SAMN05216243_0778 [Sediminibacillus albus]|uniref:Uncharacterized protein n=1 Tax=Sediminibacillus albus TaxID=407036 RepID=A0A1G8WG30_9BACI|nr:hypothetical protein SAMN05216243_0778 [Sediminibacillus albus]
MEQYLFVCTSNMDIGMFFIFEVVMSIVIQLFY